MTFFRCSTSFPITTLFTINLLKSESPSLTLTAITIKKKKMATQPLQALGRTAAAATGTAFGQDPRATQQSTLFQGVNDGPAKIVAKLTGVEDAGGKKGAEVDDSPYFTNNEAIPFPDPAHSKTVGGLPLVSDIFLLQKQQHFNRFKLLERMVHPCEFVFGEREREREE
jgi:catalase